MGDDHGGRPARRGPRPAGPGRPATGGRSSWRRARCSSTPARSGSATTRARCPGALLIERNHLEWRLDPASDARIPQATDHDVTWIVLCSEGYSSSLAAASLQDLGLRNATDLDGGFRAWKAAGLPVRSADRAAGLCRDPGLQQGGPAPNSAVSRATSLHRRTPHRVSLRVADATEAARPTPSGSASPTPGTASASGGRTAPPAAPRSSTGSPGAPATARRPPAGPPHRPRTRRRPP